jgi:hypothetical protein
MGFGLLYDVSECLNNQLQIGLIEKDLRAGIAPTAK